jgi:hypothetical protein
MAYREQALVVRPMHGAASQPRPGGRRTNQNSSMRRSQHKVGVRWQQKIKILKDVAEIERMARREAAAFGGEGPCRSVC